MSDLDTNLSQLRTSFDEIEKRIKAIERQVTSSTQLIAVKACLEEIKTLLEDYQNAYASHIENYNNHSSEFDNHKNECNQNISDLQSASSIYGASINTLTSKANAIQTSLESLSSRVFALEQNSSEGGSSGENPDGATNWEDVVYFYYGQTIQNPSYTANFYIPKTVFACAPGYVEVEMTFNFNTSSNVTIYETLSINNKSMTQHKIDTFSGNKTIVVKKQFLTSKSLNTVSIVFKVPSTEIFLNSFSIKIHAKNVKIFKFYQPIEIFCFNKNYYITDMTDANKFYYGVLSKDNFVYNKTKLNAISYSDIGYKHLATKLMPAIAYGDTIQLRADNDGKYFVAYQLGDALTYLTAFQKLTDATSYSKYCSSGSITYSDDFYPFGFNSSGQGLHHYYVLSDSVKLLSTKNTYINLTLNGVILKDYNWIYVVRDNNLNIGDPTPTYRGSVICRASDNMFVYFPDINSSYCVEIAKGRNSTAYYQPDGTIFVYINRGHQVFKYKLQKNDENKYECLGICNVFDNIIKYEELYDGYALVSNIDSCEIISP